MPHASCLRGRIVVFRPGALGDTLLTLDALAALRAAYPVATLELVGNRSATAFLAAAGAVDVATPFDAPQVTHLFLDPPVVAAAWGRAALVVLWLRSADRLAAAFRASGVPQVIAGDPEPPAENTHVADHLVETLAAAGISHSRMSWQGCGGSRPSQPSPPTDRRSVLLHPGSGSPRKNWPPDRFAALATRLLAPGRPVAVLCGPAEHAPVRALRALVSRETSEPTLPVIEPADVDALASVLCTSALVVGNDSGVTHLAAALGLATVAIFGPTNPQRWAPRGPRVAVVSGSGVWPSVQAVWSAMQELSRRSPLPPIDRPAWLPHATALCDNTVRDTAALADGGPRWKPKR